MNLVRFLDDASNPRYGHPTSSSEALPLQGGLFDPWTFAERPVRIGRRLPPIDPPNILAIGRNYADHAKEMNAAVEEEPLVFLKATTSVIGPDDAIVLPRSAPDEVDFEAELAVVIGRQAKDVPEGDAMQYVLGCTAANDVSARDCQKRRDKQWARGKSFDTFCPLGPVLVRADALDVRDVGVRSFLKRAGPSSARSEELMQDGRTRDLIFPIPFLVSWLSKQFTLLPGTVILTGTPSGVGMARTPPVFLRPGDEVAVEVEGIGRLANRVSPCPV